MLFLMQNSGTVKATRSSADSLDLMALTPLASFLREAAQRKWEPPGGAELFCTNGRLPHCGARPTGGGSLCSFGRPNSGRTSDDLCREQNGRGYRISDPFS